MNFTPDSFNKMFNHYDEVRTTSTILYRFNQLTDFVQDK